MMNTFSIKSNFAEKSDFRTRSLHKRVNKGSIDQNRLSTEPINTHLNQ